MSTIIHERKSILRKKKTVQELTELLNKYDIVGIVQMENLGASQLMGIKKKLKGKAIIKMAKNSLMIRAIDNCKKKNIEKLKDYVQGSCAFIFSEMGGFKLFQFLKQNKTKAFAKPGAIAPQDIIVPAGNTGFQPGPMITEFNELGLKTKIVQGSIWIAEDTLVVKEGEEIPRKIAALLTKLNIQPMEVGLELIALYDNGDIFRREDLDIDVEEIKAQIAEAYNQAFNLSVNVAYPTKENITHIISVAQSKALNLIHNADIILPETINDVIAKAEAQASSLYNTLKEKNPNI